MFLKSPEDNLLQLMKQNISVTCLKKHMNSLLYIEKKLHHPETFPYSSKQANGG
jgi:hypothetical protein